MKQSIAAITLTFLLSSQIFAGLKSPFKSTVKELSIPNSHQVDDNIFRGMAPLDKVEELLDFGVTDVLIFKSQGRKEVDKEKEDLASLGYSSRNVHHIPFKWKGYESLQSACEQTVDALRIMRKVDSSPSKKLFFHCTVGEDRTGFLSAIYKMLTEKKSRNELFKNEMCKNGYARGNPNKPAFVVQSIRNELTVLYTLMANKVETNKLRLNYLSKRVCKFSTSEIKKAQKRSKKYLCKKQSIE